MDHVRGWSLARVGRIVAVVVASLAGATAATAALEWWVGIDNASMVYIVAVAATAILAGTPGAIATSLGAFLLYDFFFVDPRYTLVIEKPQEWLNLVLLLFVAILVGQLAAAQRRQTETAREREHEARALFRVSRALAVRSSTADVAQAVAVRLVEDTSVTRAWIEAAGPDGENRTLADAERGRPRPVGTVVHVLRRTEGDAPAAWRRVHTGSGATRAGPVGERQEILVKVLMESGGRRMGSLWASLAPREGLPGPTDTRLLAAVADQLAQALEQDRLARQARDAEIVRESDRAKTALLETVSHDLRTPLASIRAAAGTLLDRGVEPTLDDRYAAAESIDRDAERLNRIVTNLLDLSRVEAGALHARLDGYDLLDLVETALDRARPRLGARRIELDAADLPPVRVDPVFLDQILDNLLENVARYAVRSAPLRVTATPPAGGHVRLTVEDGGPGVPDPELGRVFDKFYRVTRMGAAPSSGSGLGLAVVRGLADAMGARVAARRSELGGLAVDLDLAVADAEPAPASEPDARPEPAVGPRPRPVVEASS